MPEQGRETRKGQGDEEVLIDHVAAQRIRDQREIMGFSPEALSAAIKEASVDENWGGRGAVDAHTIRRIENTGHVPGTRVQFVLARFLFEETPHEVWQPRPSRIAA